MSIPAGWYQDPDSPGHMRYWDGTQWAQPPPTEESQHWHVTGFAPVPKLERTAARTAHQPAHLKRKERLWPAVAAPVFGAIAGIWTLVQVNVDTNERERSQAEASASAVSRDAYLTELREFDNSSIDASTDSVLLEAGYSVCASLDGGATVTQLNATISRKFDVSATGMITGGAVAAFCPQYLDELQDLAQSNV